MAFPSFFDGRICNLLQIKEIYFSKSVNGFWRKVDFGRGACNVLISGGLLAWLCVLGVFGKDPAVGEERDFVYCARGLDLFVAAVAVDGAGGDEGGVLAPDPVFEPAPRTAVEFGVLRDGITGQECVGGAGEVGRRGEVAAVEAGVGEGARWEGVQLMVFEPVFSGCRSL